LVFIGILLSGSGAAIYFMRVRSDELKGRYPPTTCEKSFANRVGTPGHLKTGEELKSSLALWERNAVTEYLTNTALIKKDKPTEYGFVMQCFCRYQ